MADLTDKFLSKLHRETLANHIKWTISPVNFKLKTSESVSGKVYVTEIQGKIFRIYEYLEKNYYEEEAYTLTDYHRLEMIDSDGKTLYEYPYSRVIFDLYRAVQYQTSGAGDFMTDFLKEGDGSDLI